MFFTTLRMSTEAETTQSPVLPAPYDIVWSAVIFLIVLVFFWKFVLPRVQTMLDARAEAIEGNIAKADEAQREAEKLRDKYAAQLANARTEAGTIRETAREDGKKIIAEAKEVATAEAERMTQTASAQIEAERQAAMVSLRNEVGTLALDLAGKVIGEAVAHDKKSTAIVDRFLAELEADSAGKTAGKK